MVEGGGFEPPKDEPADLQSAPFDRSGIPPTGKPIIIVIFNFTSQPPARVNLCFFTIKAVSHHDSGSKCSTGGRCLVIVRCNLVSQNLTEEKLGTL